MPRAKKKKLDAVRDRALEQVDSANAENKDPLVALEPAAAHTPRAADMRQAGEGAAARASCSSSSSVESCLA